MSRQPEGGTTPVELEFDSILAAVKQVQTISDTIGSLETSFKGFAGGISPSDWSSQSACQQFGASYKAAVTVYADVIAGMKADLTKYAQALQAASTEYRKNDDNAAAALTKLGAVDDGGLAQDSKGQGTYHEKSQHEKLSSDHPEQATDTTPDDRTGATKMPTAGNGGSGGSGASNPTPANAGAGQSTQPNRPAGSSNTGLK